MAFVQLNNVTLQFPVIYDPRQLSIRKKLVQVINPIAKKHDRYPAKAKTALHNITMQLNKDDRVGLIGCNGAGKSTLLHVIADIYKPNKGTVEIAGRVLPLFDLNVGIEAEATGYENIILQGMCYGLSKQQAQDLTPNIEKFSQLGDALNTPVNTYSSGMRLRLAFALLTELKGDILLLDEVVGAGDASFHMKAKQRLGDLLNAVSIVVLASHSELLIREYCNKVMLIHQGETIYYGDIDTAFKEYRSLLGQ